MVLFQKRNNPSFGYLLATPEGDPRVWSSSPGQTISNSSSEPPWLVVEPAFENLRLATWPCRLLYVEIGKPLPVQGHRGTYVRATSIKVIEERDCAELLGKRGSRVAEIIEETARLSVDELSQLSKERPTGVGDILANLRQRIMEDPAPYKFKDANNSVSPIGNAEFLIAASVQKTIWTNIGRDAWDGDDSQSFVKEPWASAISSIIGYALAEAVSELLTYDERRVLSHSWVNRAKSLSISKEA